MDMRLFAVVFISWYVAFVLLRGFNIRFSRTHFLPRLIALWFSLLGVQCELASDYSDKSTQGLCVEQGPVPHITVIQNDLLSLRVRCLSQSPGVLDWLGQLDP